MPTSADISVVVQGPIRRATGIDGYGTADALASVRAQLPQAEIILSTWDGEDLTGLPADRIVASADPGPLAWPPFRTNNVNRMVRSTAAGLAVATRPLAVKTRTDTLLVSDSLIHRPLAPANPALGATARVHVAALGTKNPLTTGYHFHPSDLVQFGRTADLRRLWSAPVASLHDVFHDPCPARPSGGVRLSPEQWVFRGFLRRAGVDAEIESLQDLRLDPFATSMRCLLGAIDVFDELACGVRLPPRMHLIVPDWECINEAGLRGLRGYWHATPDAARSLHATMLENIAVLTRQAEEAGVSRDAA